MTQEDRKWLRGLYSRIVFSTFVIVFSLCYIITTALLTFVYELIPFTDLWAYLVLTYMATGGLSIVVIMAHREYWRFLVNFVNKFSANKTE